MASNDIAQKSFNPSWMQASPLKMPKSNGMHRTSNDDDDTMMEPIFAKHRYGREDILALIPKDSTGGPPDGLHKCPFFVDKPLTPIILTSLSETEQRLQQNINSSKALSAAHRNEWQGKDNDGSNSPQTNNPWTIAGSSRSGSSSFRGTNNRWQNNSNDSNRPTKPYSGFGRPAYNAGNSGPDKRPVKNAWNDSNGGGYKPRQHLKSGSEDTPRSTEDAEQPKVPNPDAWSNAWRSNDTKYGEKAKSTEPTKPQTTFNRATEIAKNEQVPKENIWSSTLHNVWTPPSLSEAPNEMEKPHNNIKHSASLEQNERSKVVQPNPAEFLDPDQWYYLDPQDTQRGPFSSEQMHAWFISGYFQHDLRIRNATVENFTNLGELIKLNGALTPFANSKSMEASPSPVAPNIPASVSWTSEPTKPQQEQPRELFSNHSIETLKLLEVKERMIAEEKRKLLEKEEALKREEREREEKNASLREMQRQLELQRQEMENHAREQERLLEIRRLQILEYERQQREKLEKLEAERKLQIQQEEMNRRRLAELELAQKEKLRQELRIQAELKEQEEKRQLELRLKKEEAERVAAAERLRQEQAVEFERQKAMLQAQQLAQQKLLAQQQKLAAAKAAPWSTASKQPKTAQFSEIQQQEQMEAQRRQQIEEEKRREAESTQKRPNTVVQNNGNPWNVAKTVAKPVPIPPAKEPQTKTATPKAQKKSPVKEAKSADPLTTWVVERIRQMNPNVDSEVFATFLLGIESPNEIEDYIFSYFGETKAAKQFHQDFLAKRIELRPRRGAKKEDDLSSPAQAMDTAGSSNAKSNKKSKKGKKVDVSALMNFRPVGDATRFNAGEIDLDLPASTKKSKKK